MAGSPVVEQLARVPLFSTLGQAELRHVADLVGERRVPAGEAVCREGEPGHELYLVIDGEATVDRGGRELSVLGPGDVFGELALLDRAPRFATVTARSDLQLLVLGEIDFSSLLDEIPALAHKLLALLAARLREAVGAADG